LGLLAWQCAGGEGGSHVLDERIPKRPSHASQPSLPSVWMLARQKPAMAATATKTAVQVPCTESELSPMEMPSIPEPATQVQTVAERLAGVRYRARIESMEGPT
jgi:hypothetical protein